MSARLNLVGFVFLSSVFSGCSVLLVDNECDTAQDCPNATDRCIARTCVAGVVDVGFPEVGDDASVDASVDTGVPDAGVPDTGEPVDTGEPPDPCPGGTIVVTEDVTETTRWVQDCVYELDDIIFVEGEDTVLNIDPGTLIKGRNGSALVIAAGSRIRAIGTAQAPIVFTSSQQEGFRRPGDWGGVALLGRAPITARRNIATQGPPVYVPTSTEALEGLDDPRGVYGGTDVDHSCGDMKYVRIEFAGFQAFVNNELNGLTLGGCGISTLLQFVQVHFGFDDGIEFFGGSAFMQNIVISRAQDDSLDWDEGWQGAGQYIIIQQDAPVVGDDLRRGGDNGIEADGLEEEPNATPRSRPVLANLTIIGSNVEGGRGRGMRLRFGTGADIRNLIVMGHPVAGLDIGDQDTTNCALGRPPCADSSLNIQGAILYDLGADGMTYGEPDGLADGIDETAWLRSKTVIFEDPLLVNPYNLRNPSFEPIASSLAMTSTIAMPAPTEADGLPANLSEQFDRTLPNFLGAVRNGGDWTDGWTAFPEN